MSADDLSGVRASSLVSCVRAAYYQAVDAPSEDVHQNARRVWRIRARQNDSLVQEKAEQLRALGSEITLEQEVPWGEGWTGHADLVDHTDRMVYEFTGSDDLTVERRKMLQVALYARNISAERGHHYDAVIIVFSPSNGQERPIPVNWKALAWEVQDLEAELFAALEAEQEPERACKTPSDGKAFFCPFAGFCFRDWEFPPVGEIEDPALKADVARAYALSRKADTKLIDADLRPLKKQVAAQLKPSAKYRVPVEGGVIEVRRTDVKGARSVSLKEIEEAGFTLPEELLPFVKEGDGHTKLETKFYEGQE